MPGVFEFLDVYGNRSGVDRKVLFCGFRTDVVLENPDVGNIIHELGRTGRRYELCYNLKTAALKDKDSAGSHTPWKVRQEALYHQFDVGSGNQFWLFGDPHASMKLKTAEMFNEKIAHHGRFGTFTQAFKSSLDVHMLVARWATEGWRQYIEYLEEEASRLVTKPHIPPSIRWSRYPADTIQAEDLYFATDYSASSLLKPVDFLRVQQNERVAREAIAVLQSNADNLECLVRFYSQLLSDEQFPQAERNNCLQVFVRFEFRLNEIIYEMRMQTRHAGVLSSNIASARETVSSKSMHNRVFAYDAGCSSRSCYKRRAQPEPNDSPPQCGGRPRRAPTKPSP